MEETGNKERRHRDEIFSKSVKAGRRIYYFDVRPTKSGEFYITITESKKVFSDLDGKNHYEKHKIFLFREDFEKFANGLQEVVEYIRNINPQEPAIEKNPDNGISDITFGELKENNEPEEENNNSCSH